MIEPVCAKFKGEKEVVVKQLARATGRADAIAAAADVVAADAATFISLSFPIFFPSF